MKGGFTKLIAASLAQPHLISYLFSKCFWDADNKTAYFY